MKKNVIVLLLGLAFVTTKAQIVINEVMYNLPGEDSLEYIELYNAGDNDVDLTGYSFVDGVSGELPSIVLASGNYLVMAADSAKVEAAFGISNVYQWESGGLSNGGENIALADADSNIVDEVEYDDAAPWPVEADGEGYSLELCNPNSDNNDASNWAISNHPVAGLVIDSVQIYGTPGAPNEPNCVTNNRTIQLNNHDLVSIYPNPIANNQINFSKVISGRIINVLGKSVLKFENAKTVSVNLDRGVYFVIVKGTHQTLKFVVK